VILPPLNRDRVDDADYGDDRIPDHLPGRYLQTDVHPSGHTYGDGRCDRHLFDVLERVVDDDTDLEEADDETYARLVSARDAGWYRQQFSARLTCVRCGTVEAWRGTREVRSLRQLEPEPLRAGQLQAQQVAGGSYPTFTVYDVDGQRVGVIGWARGPRGRQFYGGRLGTLLGDDSDPRAEGDTPLAVLRKLSRLHAARTADSISTVVLTPGTTP
jgi:hypothetical protein